MRLVELNIKNYKSLGNVTFRPGPLSVLVGPNGSGKSNFASALSFLAEVYEFGLETAVRRKGGFENIAMRGGQLPPVVEFEVTVEVDVINETQKFIDRNRDKELWTAFELIFEQTKQTDSPKSQDVLDNLKSTFKFSHFFSIRSLKSLSLEFFVFDEKIKIGSLNGEYFEEFRRKQPFEVSQNKDLAGSLILAFTPQRLGFSLFYFDVFEQFKKNLSRTVIYQLNPLSTRQPGSPTPNPEINTYGDNLPSLVDWLKTKKPDTWVGVLHVMQSVLPTLTDIKTDYLHNRRLGLFFYENNSDQPWNSEEVSDGTILTLAVLCTVFDPRKPLVLIEEIENSLHPWALRTLIEEIRKQSSEKNIILTTHSPLVLDMLNPDEVWCVSKPKNETHLDRLVDLAPDIEQDWANGDIRISDYLDAGLVPNAVPGGLQ